LKGHGRTRKQIKALVETTACDKGVLQKRGSLMDGSDISLKNNHTLLNIKVTLVFIQHNLNVYSSLPFSSWIHWLHLHCIHSAPFPTSVSFSKYLNTYYIGNLGVWPLQHWKLIKSGAGVVTSKFPAFNVLILFGQAYLVEQITFQKYEIVI